MNHYFNLAAIGHIETCFSDKFGIPRQSLLAPSAKGRLVLYSPYNHPECLEDLEGLSHLWLSFIFHQHLEQGWKAKVRPPRLGGNKKCGVFATRSSFRPNALGLSLVKLDSIAIESDGAYSQAVLYLSGVDVVTHTPIVDIKPYVPYADSIDDAFNRLAPALPDVVPVVFSKRAEHQLTHGIETNKEDLKQLIIEVLQQDPRPAYKGRDDDKIYKIKLWSHEVEWESVLLNNEVAIRVINVI